MVCPFLSEMEVRYCRLAPRRKLIPGTQPAAGERCSSSAFAECAAYRASGLEAADRPLCPCLEESLMQYCSAAPVPRFVPWSEAAVSRCGNGAFRYCDLYLDMVGAPPVPAADEIPVPANLFYSANHLWLDRTADLCHVGIDAFLARVLGDAAGIEYVTYSGWHLPAAILKTACGHEWQVTFPARMCLSAVNRNLRACPERLVSDPYGRGWMFSGTEVEFEHAVPGERAAAWMQEEVRRLNGFIQERTGVAADGGVFERGLLAHLKRDDARLLFHEFFSPGSSPVTEIR